jgi:hypothetical protein
MIINLDHFDWLPFVNVKRTKHKKP